MTAALRIGMAGLGNVGASVARLLERQADMLAARAGRPLKLVAVSARDKTRDRGFSLDGIKWHDDPRALAADADVDLVVELMGGATGAAFDLVTAALAAGKPVVTANKALLAERAGDLPSGADLSFEAAVAGGIPVIKTLREGLAANRTQAVYGILNGTCNFILSTMTATGRSFDDVLAEAQRLGYAEADPSFDVDGVDTAHKLSILAGLAFGAAPDVAAIRISGIRGVSAEDILHARELGYRIKLLGVARMTPQGVEQSVEPCLVPESSPVAAVDGPLNAVYTDNDFAGKILLVGAGAGGDATASAVVADIVDTARGRALPLSLSGRMAAADIGRRAGSYYIRLMVLDQPGVVADVSAILRDYRISLESVLQRGRAPGQAVPLILTTHETTEADIRAAVGKMANLPTITEEPHLMRIEAFR